MTEDIMLPMLKEECPVSVASITRNSYEILLDEEIKEPSYYRSALQILRSAQEGELVTVFINSPGGRLDSAIALIGAIRECEADVLAVLEGETHSAASLIALSCHGIHVKEYASMLCHPAFFGSVGTTQNVIDHVNFTTRQAEKVMRDVYKHFLSQTEIDELVRNREIWLDADQICDRLEIMHEMRQMELEEMHEEYQKSLEEDFGKLSPVQDMELESIPLTKPKKSRTKTLA